VIVTGDINIHLECHETHSRHFTELLASYGLQSRVQTATHDRGGWLDVVATHSDLASPIVEVTDPGFSDHHLLQWTSALDRPSPVYPMTTGRPWRSINNDNFTNLLCQSAISNIKSSDFAELAINVDKMCDLYIAEVTSIADSIAPSRTSTQRV